MLSRYFHFSRYMVFLIFLHVSSPSHANFYDKLDGLRHVLLQPCKWRARKVGRSIGMGKIKTENSRVGYNLLLIKTESTKKNQKPLTTNCWNMSRHHGWDTEKQKKKTNPGPLSNSLSLAWKNSSFSSQPKEEVRSKQWIFHIWWLRWRFLSINCVWRIIIVSLSRRAHYWFQELGFTPIKNRIGEWWTRRIFPGVGVGVGVEVGVVVVWVGGVGVGLWVGGGGGGGGGRGGRWGMTNHVYWKESRYWLVGVYPWCKWCKAWCRTLLGQQKLLRSQLKQTPMTLVVYHSITAHPWHRIFFRLHQG